MRVAIIGGGVSGLSQAFFLKHFLPNSQLTILSSNIGGSMQSFTSPSMNTFHTGPRSLRNSPEITSTIQIIKQLGLEPQLILSEKHPEIYLHYGGKMRCLARSNDKYAILKSIRDHLSLSLFRLKWTGYNSQVKEGDKSVGEYIKDKLRVGPIGLEGLYQLLGLKIGDSALQGIYATDIHDLSSEVIFKSYLKDTQYQQVLSQYKGSANQLLKQTQQFTFQHGLGQFTQAIYNHLKDKGVRFIQANIEQVVLDNGKVNIMGEEYDQVFVCIPLEQAQTLVSNSILNKQVIDTFNTLQSNSLGSVNISFDSQVLPEKLQNSFGFLIPTLCKSKIYGSLFDSQCFPSLFANPSVTVMVRDSAMIQANIHTQQDKQQLEQLAIQELQKYIPFHSNQVKEAHGQVWKNFFPVFQKGHLKKIQFIEDYFKQSHSKFHLHGNYLKSAAIPYLINVSKINALKLQEEYK